jgi:hypothetical protein
MGKLPKRSASLIQRQHMVREWRLSGTHFNPPNVAKWAGKRLIGLQIPDIEHENPRGVGKGRLLTLS